MIHKRRRRAQLELFEMLSNYSISLKDLSASKVDKFNLTHVGVPWPIHAHSTCTNPFLFRIRPPIIIPISSVEFKMKF